MRAPPPPRVLFSFNRHADDVPVSTTLNRRAPLPPGTYNYYVGMRCEKTWSRGGSLYFFFLYYTQTGNDRTYTFSTPNIIHGCRARRLLHYYATTTTIIITIIKLFFLSVDRTTCVAYVYDDKHAASHTRNIEVRSGRVRPVTEEIFTYFLLFGFFPTRQRPRCRRGSVPSVCVP